MVLELKDLRESNEFLNAVIDNINSAVFIVDKDARIQQFNGAMERLFSKSEENLLGQLCGNAMGCAFAVKEDVLCGKSSYCEMCELRLSILRAFIDKVPTCKRKLVREFFIGGGPPVLKHFECTTRYIPYNGQEMILVIVDDITEGETQRLSLMEKQKRIDEDLRAAAGIQQTLLPQRLPSVNGLDIAWRFEPCELIGGDIFNVLQLDEDHLAFYLLDVSGHGAPAALVTVSVSQALATFRTGGSLMSPSQVCRALDELYPFERFHTFFTMIYVVMNVSRGYFDYCSAGHPPLAMLCRDGRIEWLNEGGTIIGMKGIVPFDEQRVHLESGDRIILYTDGVLEHRGSRGDLFGQERFEERLRELRDRPMDELVGKVLESVKEFGNNEPFEDDVSLLGIDYRR